MKIDMSGERPTIDARDLGTLFNLPAHEVQTLMRAGKITSRLETGENEDAGKTRLTFFLNRRRVRLTCALDGTVLMTSRIGMERS